MDFVVAVVRVHVGIKIAIKMVNVMINLVSH